MISSYLIILGAIGIVLSLFSFYSNSNSDVLPIYSLSFGVPIFVLGLLWAIYDHRKYGESKYKMEIWIRRIFLWIGILILIFLVGMALSLASVWRSG